MAIDAVKRSRSDSTRASILASAARIFAESGCAGARMDAIAAAAGVNKALLYYYFASKDSLYAAVIEEQFREFNERAVALLESEGSPRSILLRYVDLHFETVSHKRRFAPLHQQMISNPNPALVALVRKFAVPRSRAFHRLIERGVQGREFRAVDVRNAAISVVAVIVFYFAAAPLLKLVSPVDPYGKAELRRRKRAVFDFIRHSLFQDPDKSVT
jgi:TetR/AcrR family transcriptional regulator